MLPVPCAGSRPKPLAPSAPRQVAVPQPDDRARWYGIIAPLASERQSGIAKLIKAPRPGPGDGKRQRTWRSPCGTCVTVTCRPSGRRWVMSGPATWRRSPAATTTTGLPSCALEQGAIRSGGHRAHSAGRRRGGWPRGSLRPVGRAGSHLLGRSRLLGARGRHRCPGCPARLGAHAPAAGNAAADNAGSIRVLQKCGFAITGRGRVFAQARGGEIDEVTLSLV